MTAIYGKRNISVPMERPVARDSFLTARYLGVSRSSVIRSALQAWIDQTAGQRADVSEVPLPKRPRQKRSDPNSKQLRGAKVLPPRPMVTSFTADFDFVQDVRRASKLTGVPISIYVEKAPFDWMESASLADSESGRELRALNPFTGVLTQEVWLVALQGVDRKPGECG
ncbi:MULTISPECIES: hypothetical protein [Rhodococcus]|uniref:hypothetical protein n=1 Tax=Rhodococcus TaxID=1827 RepID=UPI0011D00158|nr:hypothetical protein [Rhodococcus sp. KBW08]